MKTLIRNATLLTAAPDNGFEPFDGDLLIDGARIAAIGDLPEQTEADTVVDGRGKLVMPGLINGHTHSSETFLKGRYESMPLEIWLLYAYPFFIDAPLPPRMLYLRSIMLALESLRSGVTTLCDDFFDPPAHELDRLGAAFQAYDDAGIRANVSSAAMNVPALDALPYAREIVPDDLQRKLDFGPPMSAETYIDYCKAAFAAFHGRSDRLRFMITPSAPQRCTSDLLAGSHELAQAHGVPFHTHILETVVQAATGPEIYGKSLIEYLHDIGALSRNTAVAHSVWVTPRDIELMGEHRCSVIHNTMSNLKLGSGLAPIRDLIDAGVTLGLGTDGLSSNDTARIFDVMRTAGLIHNGPDRGSDKWLTARIILEAATLGGARTAMLDDVTGSLEPGKAADLIVLDLDSYNFTPLNDVAKHLVYAENGSSIEKVFVNGRLVVDDGRITTVDERAILDEVRDAMPAFLSRHTELERLSAVLEPYMSAIHQRAANAFGHTRHS